MDDPLTVDTAAIRGRDGNIYSLPRPARHHDVGRHMIESGHPRPFPGGAAQGFILSDGRFAGREEAAGVALGAGQIKGGQMVAPPNLYSEDIW